MVGMVLFSPCALLLNLSSFMCIIFRARLYKETVS